MVLKFSISHYFVANKIKAVFYPKPYRLLAYINNFATTIKKKFIPGHCF